MITSEYEERPIFFIRVAEPIYTRLVLNSVRVFILSFCILFFVCFWTLCTEGGQRESSPVPTETFRKK